jgi:hypothetical protein
MNEVIKDYIGDGVYVTWDGYAIRLSTPREDGEHWIELDAHTYAGLLRFVERLKETGGNE